MKIALIGNMNNNNFALMRYFRDLGADAHLLLYSNDGTGCLSHFTPEADTWEIERWAPFIHRTPIADSPLSCLDFPDSWLLGFRHLAWRCLGRRGVFESPVTTAEIRRTYGVYDKLLSSGSTPAVLSRIDRSVDVFYPYCIGVELLAGPPWRAILNSSSGNRKRLLFRVQQRQVSGLARAKHVVATDGSTTEALSSVNVRSKTMCIPMVYNQEIAPTSAPNAALGEAVRMLEACRLSVLHHARLMWKPDSRHSDAQNHESSKNSDWLFHAFAGLLAARPGCRARLFVVEYGPDIAATKALVAELGIDNMVSWLPKMARKELMWLLERVSLAVGEFKNQPDMIWGGTGWETLAAGKPLLQGFRFEEGEFERLYGYPPPPLIPIRSQVDVLNGLLLAADHPEEAAKMGKRAREWFDTHNGISLAKKWLALVTGT